MDSFSADANARHANLMHMMGRILAIVVIEILVCPSLVLADGGTLRLSQRCGNFQVSVFTSPAVLQCGPVDVSVLVQDVQTGKVRTDVPVMVRLQRLNDNGRETVDVLEQQATTDAATNKLFQASLFDVDAPGTWRVRILLGSGTNDAGLNKPAGNSLVFNLNISPPPPAWMTLAPWFCWPAAPIALFLMHQWLANRSRQNEN